MKKWIIVVALGFMCVSVAHAQQQMPMPPQISNQARGSVDYGTPALKDVFGNLGLALAQAQAQNAALQAQIANLQAQLAAKSAEPAKADPPK
jgi:Skp family chaperone for outer membrane proteins